MEFSDFGIQVDPLAAGPEVAATCPKCSSDRKKARVKCLSVNVREGVWNCHHCDWTGSLRATGAPRGHERTYWRPEPRPKVEMPAEGLAWLLARGITRSVIERNQVSHSRAFFPQLDRKADAVVFPYFRDGEEINRKYRAVGSKDFRMEAGCELTLYGLDDIDPAKPLVWVEGEMDKLACEVAGFRNVVSVPNGAPPVGAKNYDAKLAFLEADRERIDAVQQHIIAVDADAPGKALGDELIRRLGPERCLRVRWPEGSKDANDVLLKHGAFGVEELQWRIEHAEPVPIEGVIDVADLREEIIALHANGIERGRATGWAALDPYYTVKPGELTVVTGIPSSGKSNFIDCLMVNLAAAHDWRFALFSPENLPTEQHMAMIAEKYAGAPFFLSEYGRIKREQLDRALDWAGEHFSWIMPSSEDDWTVEKILDAAGKLCLRRGIRGLVLDPWNELEALRPPSMSETEYVSHALKRIRVFARQRQIHVWVVVHPAKMYRGDGGAYPVPTLYDCSGSAHWRNKADNGLVVFRKLDAEDQAEVQIHVQKIRFRHVGKRGMVKLYYHSACATYREVPNMKMGDF